MFQKLFSALPNVPSHRLRNKQTRSLRFKRFEERQLLSASADVDEDDYDLWAAKYGYVLELVDVEA
jgi:hypothetical protein